MGKTTVARILAKRLGWDAVDADDVIEERAGRSVRQIFAEEGEAGFRARETAVLEELCRRQRCVIATGGGAVLAPANCERMRQAGRVAWLTADPETIWQRMQGDPSNRERRPNLTVGGLSEIRELLSQREPLYRACADWVVDTAARPPEEVADLILARWVAEGASNA